MPLIEGEDRWPPFGKISVAAEGFVYYSQYSTKVIIHDLAKYFPSSSHVTIHHSIMMLAAIGSFGFAYFSDDYFGKYRAVLLFYLIGSFGPIIGLFGLVYPTFSWIFTWSLYIWVPILAVEATRMALMSEQFKIPQTLRSLKLFYFFVMVSRYAGTGAAGLLIRVETFFGGLTTQLIVRTAVNMLVAIIYTLILIFFVKKMRRKRIEVGVVDSVIACIFSALYNRTFRRKKMPEDCKWIEFSDAKYFKETRDSALQLVEMSLIYMPFSLFFGLNEFLDVIWLEQDEWIGTEDSAEFLSAFSIMSSYHIIDVVLLPFFEYLIEFVLPKCKILLSDLQLIGSAVFLLGLAYLATTVLQSFIENGDYPRQSSTTLRFFDGMAANATVSTPFSPTIVLQSGESFDINDIKPKDVRENGMFSFQAKIFAIVAQEVPLEANVGSISTYVLTDDGVIRLPYMKIHAASVPEILVINSVGGPTEEFALRFHKIKTHEGHGAHGGHGGHGGGHGHDIEQMPDEYQMKIPVVGTFEKLHSSKGKWQVRLSFKGNVTYEEILTVLPNSQNTVFVCYDKNKSLRFSLSTGTNAQTVTLLYALPQVLLRCLADGIGKISTYFFTYTQAPRKLRATCFGVLYFAQFSFPSFIGLLSSVWNEGFSAFTLSIYTFIVFVSLIFFMRFALKYEEI